MFMNAFDHLHPMLVHFPIAFFTGAFILQAGYFIFRKESMRQAALWVYILAVCFTPLTAWTGLTEEWKHRINHPVLTIHKNSAFFVLAVSFASIPVLWMLQKKSRRTFDYTLMFFIVLLVAGTMLTAYNGGRLVYEYGVGVEQ